LRDIVVADARGDVPQIRSLMVTGWIGGTRSSASEPLGLVTYSPTSCGQNDGMYFDTGSGSAKLAPHRSDS